MNPLERVAQFCTDSPAIPRDEVAKKPARSSSRPTASTSADGSSRTATSVDASLSSRCGCV